MLHHDRFFSPDPTTRKLARQLDEPIAGLAIISPHGHVAPHARFTAHMLMEMARMSNEDGLVMQLPPVRGATTTTSFFGNLDWIKVVVFPCKLNILAIYARS